MLASLLPADLFAFFLVFARTGSTLMMMPGIGETYVLPRVRLIIAGGITLLVTPTLMGSLPAMPGSPVVLFVLLFGEIAIGLFFGTIGRVIMASLHTAGTVMAFQTGLANALSYDPNTAQQAALPATFLTTAGLLVVFAADLHHLMIGAMVRSYEVLVPGQLPIDDIAQVVSRLVADSFILGFQLAAPFVAMALVFYLGIGLLARLMPQVQIFFIAMPVQIFLGISTLALTSSAILMWFLNRFQDTFLGALGG
jgi:flagellar biosynthetic protein FliR